MSVARHHAEWISLLETSGSFLSLPVLLRVFPQGLEAHDPALARALRLAYDEWDENRTAKRPDPTIHHEWLRFVLEAALGYPRELILGPDAIPAGMEAKVAEHRETIRPDLVIVAPAGRPDSGSPRLLVQLLPPGQGLEKTLADVSWKVSPASRMTELLKSTGVRLGLLTNGEDWMLVHRGESFTYVTWSAPLWFEEPLTLRAFTSLLGARRLFGVADADTLEEMLKESYQNQQEVTDQLGLQVRRAVEVLVQALDGCDKDLSRTLLANVSEKEVYEAALTVMMRLVFLFSAEERGLLLLADPLYDRFYAVSTLGAQLREEADRHGQSLLERRHDAWPRLVALFRAVYAGAVHDSLQIPAYGGALFNPDRFPFLEGRPPGSRWREVAAAPLPINNRTVLHVVEALQFLRLKVPGGGPAEPRRLSFRGLGIEQIGHVYEGLLDHSAIRAASPVLGLAGAREKEEEIPLPELETYRSRGMDDLVEFLTVRTGRSARTLTKALGEYDAAETELFGCCDNDRALVDRVRPFAGILRRDDNDTPLVITPGSLYVTRTGDRRSTGTHYTPPSLTEPVVKYTLEPLVYDGPAEGRPHAEWRLRTPRELLALRVCDIAMGSGAFLVQACRYLAERLVEAWEEVERASPGRVLITPEGDLSAGDPGERLIPRDPDERLTIARRLVADRCLHGVDKNPQAVEMAKLSLWLVTSAKGRPFTFLDHALRCGDSLVGAEEETFLKWTQLGGKKAGTLYDDELHRALDVARTKRRELESFEVKDVRDAERKGALLAEAERVIARIKQGCDVIVGTKLICPSPRERALRFRKAFLEFKRGGQIEDLEALEAFREACSTHAFHWHMEFPEVFERGGFDAVLGNPPFLWGMRISSTYGENYLKFLQSNSKVSLGTADLCSHFLRRAHGLLKQNGCLGLIVVDTIAQGDTRAVGIQILTEVGARIYRAQSSQPWPGTAGVKYCQVFMAKSAWNGSYVLDSAYVEAISSRLLPEDDALPPMPLADNQHRSFVGHYPMGKGFILSESEAQDLVEKEPPSSKIVFRYLRGEDINQSPNQVSHDFAINFGTRSLEECEKSYPCACKRIRELVKPQRDKEKRKANRERWWQYAETRPSLSAVLQARTSVIAQPFVTKYLAPCFVDANQVFASPLVVLDFSDYAHLAVLQSSLHEAWVRKYSSTMGDRIRYTSSDCFETFPFPPMTQAMDFHGRAYYLHRQDVLKDRSVGVTDTYNLFHNRKETAADIARLRDLHVEMDNAVAAAYGWTDLLLGHDFHETKQGLRFTLSDQARREVLSRLLALNHARHKMETPTRTREVIASAKGYKRKREPLAPGLFDK